METNEILFWCAVLAQLVGLLSMAAARLSEYTPLQAPCQAFFFLCLGLMGLATIVAFQSGSGYWFPYGTTLSLMAVGATIDMRRTSAGSAY